MQIQDIIDNCDENQGRSSSRISRPNVCDESIDIDTELQFQAAIKKGEDALKLPQNRNSSTVQSSQHERSISLLDS